MFHLRVKVIILLISALMPSLAGQTCCASKGTAGSQSANESLYIVQMPTAGTLEKGSFLIYSEYFAGGGLMLQIGAAPFKDFSLGLSFGFTNFVGYGNIETQNYPGVQLIYRVIDESLSIPAILIGLNTQGRGDYLKQSAAYQVSSPGVYIAASKSFKWALGDFSLHGGFNYSIEGTPKDRNPNFYLGIEHCLGKSLSLNVEYNATTTVFSKRIISSHGLLNAAFRISVSDGLTVEIQALDLFEHLQPKKGIRRSIGFEYIQKL